MAAVPPAHAVLLNADLLALVVEHASKATNTAIRLCNKAMNVTASPSLFRTLLVSSRDRHLDRLEFVANHDQFRRGVREVVWETTAYSGMKGYDERDTWLLARRLKFTNCDFPDWDDGVDNGVRAKVFAMLGRMEELALDEIVRRGKAGGLPLGREPRKSFRKLKGLEHLVMTMWCGGVDGQRPFLAGYVTDVLRFISEKLTSEGTLYRAPTYLRTCSYPWSRTSIAMRSAPFRISRSAASSRPSRHLIAS